MLPAGWTTHVECADVAAGKQRWYWRRQHALVIKFGAARTTERLEICRVNKVAHLDPVDAVGARIVLARIAHFVSVELAVTVIRVDEDGQVDIGVGKHLQKFMARGHRPFEAIALVGAGERLGDRQTVGREVMVAKDAGTVGIVENTQLPCTGRGPGLFNAQYMTRMARIALMPPKAMRCRPSETL